MSRPDLKPCPFCGGQAIIMKMGFPHWIYCKDCGARVHGGVISEEDGEAASIEAWNRRTSYSCDHEKDHTANISKKVCVDAISRQAAIDVLHGYFDGMLETDTWSPCDVYGLIEILPSVQPDHTADHDKKVSYSCGQENDLIDRQVAIEALAKQMPKTYTPDGSHPADEEIYKIQEIYVDCIESIEILPAVQPEPLSDAYMKAVYTWLLNYQNKAAELKGRYTPHEVLSWVVNDWRKEHE